MTATQPSIDASPDPSDDFETVALPFIDDVARFALSLTRDESEADDLVQETFLRAMKGWHTFQPGTNARKWLFTICRNAFLRRRQRAQRVVLTPEEDLDAMPAALSHHEGHRSGLGDLFDRIDVGPAIRSAIDELPEPHHSILALVDVQGMSYEEASEILEVPIGTVRSRLFRARRMIQERLLAHAADLGIGVAPEAPSQGAT